MKQWLHSKLYHRFTELLHAAYFLLVGIFAHGPYSWPALLLFCAVMVAVAMGDDNAAN